MNARRDHAPHLHHDIGAIHNSTRVQRLADALGFIGCIALFFWISGGSL